MIMTAPDATGAASTAASAATAAGGRIRRTVAWLVLIAVLALLPLSGSYATGSCRRSADLRDLRDEP